jgi:hypothetical protein
MEAESVRISKLIRDVKGALRLGHIDVDGGLTTFEVTASARPNGEDKRPPRPKGVTSGSGTVDF